MPGPTTRVLALLELLQTHGRLSGAEIAQRLDVDRRTVRRYISALEDLGIPVTTEQGRHGGYLLVPGFKLPPLMFTDEEALALALGLLAVSGSDLAENRLATYSAQAKLERVLPRPLQQRLQTLREHTQVLPRASGNSTVREALLTLTTATAACQRVRMRYRSPDGEQMDRELDPYGLVFRERYWYVSGYCHLRQDLRSFRLDRLSEITLQPQGFMRPSNFDAAEHLRHSLAHAWRRHEVAVLLYTDMESATDYMGELSGLFQQLDEGLLLTTSTDSYDWFACWLAHLPFEFRVIGPDALSAAVRTLGQRLLTAGQTSPH